MSDVNTLEAIKNLTELVQSLTETSNNNAKELSALKRKFQEQSSDAESPQATPKKSRASDGSGHSGTLVVDPVRSEPKRAPEVLKLARFSCSKLKTPKSVPSVSSGGHNSEPSNASTANPTSPNQHVSSDEQDHDEVSSDFLLLDQLGDDSFNSDSDNETTVDLPIVSSETKATWSLSERSLKWFDQVSDIELKQDQIDSILKDFTPTDEVAEHFSPPLLPPSLWSRMKLESPYEMAKHRVIFKSQNLINSALKPLLSVLDNMDNSDPNQKLLASSIQLLCTSNLNLSRYRRSYVGKYIKSDMKQALLAQPVTHRHLFGSDFDSSAETIAKCQSSFQKILVPPKSKANPRPSTSSYKPQPQPSASSSSGHSHTRYNDHQRQQSSRQQPFRNRGTSQSSGRGRGGRPSRSN